MGRAPDVATARWISTTKVSGRLRRQFCCAYRARFRAERTPTQIRQPLEPGRREVNDPATPKRHGQRGIPLCHGDSGQGHRVASHHVHLILVHLDEIEATAPRCWIRKWPQSSRTVRLYGEQQGMNVAVDRTAEMLS